MSISKIITTSLKSGLFASFLLIIFIGAFEKNFGDEFILIFFLSAIITCIISFCMIVFTIIPFIYFIKEKVFKKVFPYYTILIFFGWLTISIVSNFDKEMFCITIPAFFSAMMAWVWLFKESIK